MSFENIDHVFYSSCNFLRSMNTLISHTGSVGLKSGDLSHEFRNERVFDGYDFHNPTDHDFSE